MDNDNKIIQTTGTVSSEHELQLDVALPFCVNSKVKVTISFDDDGRDFLTSAVNNPSFKDIFDDSEDIYTLEDGKPYSG